MAAFADRCDEQYHIDQMILHAQLYGKYGYKENEIGFYQHIEVLRQRWGLATYDEAIDFAEHIVMLKQGDKAS
ncbi:hypothetical protein [Lysinibacillus piscis]|uniref:Uncharacterized protein n=1 Tax=Lysinibacillus piscis TaxID=2518931 RepID=A0ABQ5NIQ1_9BACI|nr:hypothetical protein [Lysinibacillus sp. KH24]GLC88239.1 hypothetical protein LYSBPC_13660 [Lysinibacillus sp. KH24]